MIQEAYVQGISTRSVDELVKALGMAGISKSQVSRLCAEIDERVRTFLERPIEGDWPYLWIDATYVKVRDAGRIVSVAVTLAVAVNTDGRREVLGMAIGASEAETFWVDFLRKLKRRGLAGVKLVISDAHEGIKAAVARVFRASLAALPRALHAQRARPCRQERPARGVGVHRHRLRPGRRRRRQGAVAPGRGPGPLKLPKLAALLDEAEEDVLAYMTFPKEHRAKIHSTDEIDKRNCCLTSGSTRDGLARTSGCGAASDLRRVWRGAPRGRSG